MPKDPVYIKANAAPGAVYVYQGDGFIPGLPREVTIEDAEFLGVLEQLKAAIENGSYKAKSQPAAAAADEEKEA